MAEANRRQCAFFGCVSRFTGARVPTSGRDDRGRRRGFGAGRWRAGLLLGAHLGVLAVPAIAQVPGLLSFQGRVFVGDTAFHGSGQFKFSLVDAAGSRVFWANTSDANLDGVPDAAVTVPVVQGLYSVLLGDAALPNMAPLAASAFSTGDVFLRVWFHDGVSPSGFEQLAPDQRVVAVGYAMVAATVGDGAVTAGKLADGAVTGAKLAAGSVGQAQLAPGAVGSAQLAAESVGTAQLANGAVTAAKLAPGAVAATQVTGVLVPAQLPATVAYQPDLTAVSNRLTGQLADLTDRVDTLSTGGTAVPRGLVVSSDRPDDPEFLTAGYRRFATMEAPGWGEGTIAQAPSERVGHAGLWTGSRFLVWGGEVAAGTYSAAGAAYDPALDVWTPFSPFQAPSARTGMSGVWTGTEFVLWGGFGGGYLEDGAAFHPGSGVWRAIATSGAPEARDRHVALWTTGGMLVWGGRNAGGPLGSGGLYLPDTDTWTPLILPNAPEARMGATAVWTGQRALIWGGQGMGGSLNTGGELLFDDFGGAFEWRSVPTDGAPRARHGHRAVWTGTAMLIWGGMDANGDPLDDGAAYQPSTGAWTALPSAGAPTARHDHVAVWTGQEMVIAGGMTRTGPVSDGAAFDPSSGRWRPLSVRGGPLARRSATAAWAGSEMIVFGGLGEGNQRVAALQRLDPAPAWHLYRKP